MPRPVTVALQQLRTFFLCDQGNTLRHIRFTHYRRFSCPEHTRFFTPDAFTIRAKPVGVIERNAGNHRDIGIHDVCRIQPSAEADFEDHDIQLRLAEQIQRGERAKFKIGQRNFCTSGFNLRKAGAVLRLTQLLSLNPNALGIAHQMR